ncbi:heavy metal translocating P-type ATPase [Campylobacter pinnipediorum]|uniref:heavy metal translocating P-type ATPase n=1 Tax=Campylobacter pinnipediorum TaxID=1965231 RepID=UPI00084D82C9|nr:heavy metal translocating P-type ATPase [Campylobacter pinnipediorum]
MAKDRCNHCKLMFDTNSMIKTDNGIFCCNGCKNVYAIIKNNGFEEFYSRLGNNNLSPAKNSNSLESNLENLYKNYVTRKDGFNQISLIIEGIHCSACIWLNEKILFSTKGILEVNINSINNKATILWDENETNLKEILTKINSIGYKALVYDSSKEDTILNAKRRDFYIKLLVGIFALMNIMWIAIAQYAGYFSGMDKDIKDILNFAEFILASPVLFYTGGSFFNGFKIALKTKTPNMDMLVATGASLAYFYSIYAMFSRKAEVYFDSVAMIITFVFIGKFLEVLSKKRASDTLDTLNSMVLNEVNIKTEGKIISKNIHEIMVGETIVLKAGDKVVIDGIITSGEASFDCSSLSGESIPITLGPSNELKSSTVCLDGYIEYKATSEFKNSFLNKIINLIQNSSSNKPNLQQLANKIASKFSLTILIIAIFTFFFWFLKSDFQTALIIAISVIIIACPCALALATPVSTLVGIGAGLKNNVIFKQSKTIETLAKCDTIVFDKTGTLTKAKLKVDRFEQINDINLELIASLCKTSKHPVSVAIFEFLKQKNITSNINLTNIKEISAKGVMANFNNKTLIGGNKKFLQENGIMINSNQDSTEYFVAFDKVLVAKFSLSDEIKEDAKSCIKKLKKLNLDIYILTGDNEITAKKVANQLGVKNIKYEMLPDEKANFISTLNKNNKTVLMVGDGINDAIAMGYSHVAICMGSGSDISLEKSDVMILDDSLKSLTKSILISKKTMSIIKQNLFFSLSYNALTVPLAIMGFIIPLFAALSMSFSSIIVILNSLRIKNQRNKNE